MNHYTAVVEVTKRGNPTPDEVDTIMDRLAGYPVSLSVTPHGYRAATITLPADNLAAASTAAILAVTHGYGLGVADAVSIVVMTEAEADLREGAVDVPQLIGVAEAAEMLKRSPQRIRQMIDEGKLAAHRVGDRAYALVRSDVEAAAVDVIPGLGAVREQLRLHPKDIVSASRSDQIEYSWTTPDGESFESEGRPPAGALNQEQRTVSTFNVRALGRREGGRITPRDGGPETTDFTVTREGDWGPLT